MAIGSLAILFIVLFIVMAGQKPSPTVPAEGPNLAKLGPQPIRAAAFRVGERVADINFIDLDGKKGRLSDYHTAKALVIAMNLVDCPVGRKFAPALTALEREYGPRGVAFLLVNTNKLETLEHLRQTTKALGLTARYLPDLKHGIAQALDAQSSTDVFVLDRARTLVYRGPISDQYGLGYALAQPRYRYLHDALDAVVDDESVAIPALSAPGCAIGLEPSTAPETHVTFHNRISRLLQTNCQACHRQGEAGPFELMTYDDVKGHAPMIKYAVENKIMPPWFASSTHGEWQNDRSLTARDRAALLGWIQAGMPKGDPADAPLPHHWPTGWTIGEPDLVLTPPSFDVPTEGVVPYQYVTVKTRLTEDKWVSALEIRHTRPEVVHHVLVFINDGFNPHSQDHSHKLPDMGGRTGYFAARVPGQSTVIFPLGVAKRLPKGTELLFQIHYTPNGVGGADQLSLGLKFVAGQPDVEVHAASAVNAEFLIPAGNPNYPVSGVYEFKTRGRILSFLPHMHVRGKAFRYQIVYPEGKEQILLDIPRYDFNWQLRYVPRTPIDVPAGAKLTATGWFDNSPDNPANPDPTRNVPFGEQTTDEMMIGYFDWQSLE
ncbi:MAG: redoxin domain-containing protein [Gammaproteobacteria bacterium]|nr:redoxin domain-containing protein [Gammaproteobacteria bacterium]